MSIAPMGEVSLWTGQLIGSISNLSHLNSNVLGRFFVFFSGTKELSSNLVMRLISGFEIRNKLVKLNSFNIG